MTDWLADRVRASPDATALIDAGSGERATYTELDDRVGGVAAGLAERGIGAGGHVAIALEVGPAAVSLVHAVARLGAVLVPLSSRLTTRELETRAQQADCDVLVYGTDAETAASAIEDVPLLPIGTFTGESVGGHEAEPTEPTEPTGPAEGTTTTTTAVGEAPIGATATGSESLALDDPLVLLFTSGTTGRPKAVVLTAGNVLASAGASAARLGTLPGDRWLLALSMGGMGGLAPIYRSVLYGTALVLQQEFDSQGALRALSTYECSGISLVPTMLSRVLDVIEAGESGGGRDDGGGSGDSDGDGSGNSGSGEDFPSSLRFVLLGGAPASRDLIERCRVHGVPVHPTYGMTETASQVATACPAEAFANPGTVGRPLVGTRVRVVENGEVLDAGERGELVVSGPIVTPGYYGDEVATAGASSEHGFHTGDLGYIDGEGRVWVTGRLDDRILTGGRTVDPAEVREVLRAHPAVREAAVVGVDSDEWGEQVAALIIPEIDEGVSEAGGREVRKTELEAFCRERLAGYKLPRTMAVADALPRTDSGTVDRVAVAKRLREANGKYNERDDESGNNGS